jgi:hypothetical protein
MALPTILISTLALVKADWDLNSFVKANHTVMFWNTKEHRGFFMRTENLQRVLKDYKTSIHTKVRRFKGKVYKDNWVVYYTTSVLPHTTTELNHLLRKNNQCILEKKKIYDRAKHEHVLTYVIKHKYLKAARILLIKQKSDLNKIIDTMVRNINVSRIAGRACGTLRHSVMDLIALKPNDFTVGEFNVLLHEENGVTGATENYKRQLREILTAQYGIKIFF